MLVLQDPRSTGDQPILMTLWFNPPSLFNPSDDSSILFITDLLKPQQWEFMAMRSFTCIAFIPIDTTM